MISGSAWREAPDSREAPDHNEEAVIAESLALLYDEPGTIHRDVLDEIKYPVATIQGDGRGDSVGTRRRQ